MEPDSKVPVLEAVGITKRYGAVEALVGVSLEVHAGEILALVGDNGAGKSTLLSILAGVQRPNAGELRVEGRAVEFVSPLDARRLGIETVYQDLALPPHLEISDAMFLGRERLRPGILGRLGMLDRAEMRAQSRVHLDELRITIQSITQPVGTLSGGQRQAVAVGRAVAWSSKLILMDEPTAALGVEETGNVLRMVRRLRERGIAVLLVSHNLPQVLEVSDRIVVLRHGQVVATTPTADTHLDEVVKWITGSLAIQ